MKDKNILLSDLSTRQKSRTRTVFRFSPAFTPALWKMCYIHLTNSQSEETSVRFSQIIRSLVHTYIKYGVDTIQK